MKRKDTAWILMARYLAGEMDTKDEIAFVREMESDPTQKTRMQQMEQTWKYFHESHPGGTGDSLKAWDHLYRKLEHDGLLESRAPLSGKKSIGPVLRIAASILVILALGVPAVYYGFIRQDGNRSGDTYFSEKGVRTVDLPDGSRVYLNQGSEISCSSDFHRERALELRGEAYFEVMSDPVNPFTVSSGRVVVSVIGTTFSVKESGSSGKVDVFVESGSVRMSLTESGEFITLEAGEMGRAYNSLLSRSAPDDPNYLSWKTKNFKFVDTELANVLRELEESYHVQIHADGLALDQLKITTTYREQSIDAILETIATAFGLTVSKMHEDYYLTP